MCSPHLLLSVPSLALSIRTNEKWMWPSLQILRGQGLGSNQERGHLLLSLSIQLSLETPTASVRCCFMINGIACVCVCQLRRRWTGAKVIHAAREWPAPLLGGRRRRTKRWCSTAASHKAGKS
ncbi:hypothetical protein BS78_01G484400 [Paspalum vaginatum]|nr:hypothetical protein BS78_01G484400 [Paspalum vaginatum]